MYLHKTEDVFKNIKKVKELQTQYVYLAIKHIITLSIDLSPVRGQYFILWVGSIFYLLISGPDFIR
jgi:hypothetical protein